jgi:peptide/nickel transport system substrate-binding protein
MRKYYWYFTAYLRKHGLVLITSIVGAIAIFSVLVPTLVKSVDIKERSYVGIIGNYNLDNLPLEITSLISSGLTKVDETGAILPNIAERINVENDGQTYRFIIKKGIKWQDGKTLTPKDVEYNLRDIETVATKNDIVFKLPNSFAPFPNAVSKPLLKKKDEVYRWFLHRPTLMGIGDYSVISYETKGNHLNEIVLDSPDERRIYRFYFSEDDLILAFKRGEVDIISDLSQSHNLDNWKNVTVNKTLKTDRYLGLFFNNENPLFPKNVRQAFSYAVKKPGKDVRAVGPINPQSWAYLEGGKNYDFDMERAVERLLDDIPATKISFRLTTTTEFQNEAERIKNEWQDFLKDAKGKCENSKAITDKSKCDNLNGEINIKVTNFPDLNDFDTVLIGQEIPSDPDQYSLWHSDQPTNFTHYKNTRIDSLLERGRTTVDLTERTEIYQEFQQFFLEDAPAVFLRYLDNYEVKRK